MTDIRAACIEQYQKLKEINKGKEIKLPEFLQFSGISKHHLTRAFGNDAYSKLQQQCGDEPTKLTLRKTPLSQILEQYGQLVRRHGRPAFTSDWLEADFRPYVGNLRVVHNLKWSEMSSAFLEHYSNKLEWKDVIGILTGGKNPTLQNKSERAFTQIVDKLNLWVPDRRRIIEEGYKIELRNYLEQFFDIEEEVGETNPDLLIEKKYPIEVKKDPSLSEYDRLLGQMIRHNKYYGSAIALVTSISSEDRFKRFQKLFIEVHAKLEMKAELILK